MNEKKLAKIVWYSWWTIVISFITIFTILNPLTMLYATLFTVGFLFFVVGPFWAASKLL